MSQKFVVNAEVRDALGKGASRRLRRESKFPGVVYGAGKDPVSITVLQKQLNRLLEEESFYSSVLELEIGSEKEQVVLRDLQRHPSKAILLHVDFQRIVEGEELRVVIPLHFINEEECVGAKTGGGMISHAQVEVEVSCLPANIPEFVEVDVIELGAGQALHLSELVLPEGVTIPALALGAEHDDVVVSVLVRSGASDTEEEESAEGGE